MSDLQFSGAAAAGTYRYRIKTTGESSTRFGPCEVCGKHATEVFLQVEERAFDVPEALGRPDGLVGWTAHNCREPFGHEACLRSVRRTPNIGDVKRPGDFGFAQPGWDHDPIRHLWRTPNGHWISAFTMYTLPEWEILFASPGPRLIEFTVAEWTDLLAAANQPPAVEDAK